MIWGKKPPHCNNDRRVIGFKIIWLHWKGIFHSRNHLVLVDVHTHEEKSRGPLTYVYVPYPTMHIHQKKNKKKSLINDQDQCAVMRRRCWGNLTKGLKSVRRQGPHCIDSFSYFQTSSRRLARLPVPSAHLWSAPAPKFPHTGYRVPRVCYV